MIIAGKEIKTRLDTIPVSKLVPDFNNPRRHGLALDLESKGLDPDIARTPEGITQSGKFTELCRAIVETREFQCLSWYMRKQMKNTKSSMETED